MRGVREWSALSLCLVSFGCSVALNESGANEVVTNQCREDKDCSGGACWSGACVAHEGKISTVLLEVTPPAGATGGGTRYLRVASGLSRSGEDHKVDLSPLATVHGFVRAYDAKQNKACVAGQTLPVEITLTAREQAYGLPSVSYVGRSQLSKPSDLCKAAFGSEVPDNVYEFAVDVPTSGTDVNGPAGSTTGRYDVYIRPLPSEGMPGGGDAGVDGSGCALVPELLSGGSGLKVDKGTTCYAITPRAPQQLDVEIPWPASSPPLEGWTLDVLHPVTGQILSDRKTLVGRPTGASDPAYKLSLQYSQAVSDGTTTPGQELLRLSPPEGLVAPTILLGLSGLVAGTPPTPSGARRAVLPSLGPFQQQVVSLDYSIFRASDPVVPVAASVTFTAIQLDKVPYGIFASYSTSTLVGADGRLRLTVPAGRYRVRVVPDSKQPQDTVSLAAEEYVAVVGCRDDPSVAGACLPIIAQSFLAPNAAKVSGGLGSPLGSASVGGAVVQALPASVGSRSCPRGADAGACSSQVGVLDIALAEDSFVPRSATTVAGNHGEFEFTNIDCGGCSVGNPALYDLAVRPADGTRLPWLVKPDLSIYGDTILGHLDVSLPIIQRGVVDVPREGAEASTIAGALIKAYVLRDAGGQPIDDPSGLSTCSDAASTTRCIRSVLQVAETRSTAEGHFELLLPSTLLGEP